MKAFASILLRAALACLAAPAMARADPVETQRVDIAAQPLSDALNEFAKQTGAVVLARAEVLRGKSSAGLTQAASTEALLTALLDGSGLTFTQTRPNVFVVALAGRDDGGQAGDTETVVVVGRYFESLMSAVRRERAADNLIDAIDAQGIAEFPAQNVAEALQRVSGVSVTQDRGEAVFVSVRGLEANFQIVTLNGGSIAVNENVRDSGQNGRQFRFDVIPTDLVAGVEIVKSPNARTEEGAIGGVINIRTFKPLDLPNGDFSASASLSRAALAEAIDPRAALLGAWTSQDERLGVLAGLSYNTRTLRQDRITQADWEETQVALSDGAATTVLAPNAFRPTLEREDRQRFGVNGAVQIRPNDTFSFEAEAFYARLNADYRELTYSAAFDLTTLAPETLVVRDGAVVGGLARAGSQIGYEHSQMTHDNLFVSLGGAGAFTDWSTKATLTYTQANSRTDSPITRTRVSAADIGLVSFSVPRLYDGVPDLGFLEIDLNDPSALPFRRIEYRNQEARDTETAARFDGERYLSRGPFERLEAGYAFRARSRSYRRLDSLFAENAGTYFSPDFYDPFPVEDFLGGVSGDLVRRWQQPDPEAFARAANFVPEFAAPSPMDLGNSYDVDEQIQSLYLLGRFRSSVRGALARGDVGMRISHTTQISAGHVREGSVATPVRYETDYVDVLPSANLAVEFNDWLIMRAALARVITRPSLADLAPRITLNSSGAIREAVGGNPKLQRYQAWQADLAQEFAFSSTARLSLGAFYKVFDSFIYDQVSEIDIGGVAYQLTAPTNGGAAEVLGLELAYQQQFSALPAPWNGLGVQATYARVDSRADYSATVSDSLENVAKESFSVSAVFETGPVEARLVYNHTGDVLTAVGANSDLSPNRGRFGTLDLNLTYHLSDRLDLALEAQNLTDARQYQFVRDDLFAGYTQYGRVVGLSLRYRSAALGQAR